MFDRSKYYSQTEILRKFKIPLSDFKKISESIPCIRKECDLGTHKVTAYYFLKEDIKKLHFPLRDKK